jgi:uncharacterized membrane protein HdeD (DUF308 family)
VSTAAQPRVAPPLRRLYLVRFGFAVVWAALLVLTGTPFGLAAAALVVLYPLFDVAAAVVDLRRSRSRELVANVAISLVAAVGLGVAATSGVPAVLRVWGIWAIVAGAIQLVLAVRRRALGGQWPMILSGGLSVLAGAGFVASAGAAGPSLLGIAGYAALGGIFFLVSALRV